MAKWIRSQWNPNFGNITQLFHPLSIAAKEFTQRDSWPGLDEYNGLIAQLRSVLRSELGVPIQFVPQAEKSEQWHQDYEPRIYLDGAVQTRTENWHDFFQVLMWYSFPLTKSTLNALHFESIRQRKDKDPESKQRSPMENTLTQFDECGAIITCSDPELLHLVKSFKWKTLFWERRNDLLVHLRCFVFGHAIYEKALSPYTGMTAHSILLETDSVFNQQPLNKQLNYLDQTVSRKFADMEYKSPQDFAPFPLLGMPGWVAENDQESYYDNSQYFRSGRTGKS